MYKYDHVLIDGKNMLYRAMFTARNDLRFKSKGHHSVNIVLHYTSYYLNQFRPSHVHLFWDTPRNNVWRKEILSEYKNNREDNSQSGEDTSKFLNDLTKSTMVLFNHMGIKQYYRSKMEADDLIFAFCKMNLGSKILIVSGDSDLKQIPFAFRKIDLHNPLSKKDIEPLPEYNPIIIKSLMGDKTDNIYGYDGIGKVRSRKLASNYNKLKEFFESPKAVVKVDNQKVRVGDQKFRDNLKIIDLSLCPDLIDNMVYVAERQSQPSKFNLEKIRDTISKYKMRGVTADLDRYIMPFKILDGE